MVSGSRDELHLLSKSRLKGNKCSDKESRNFAVSDGAAPLPKRRREKKTQLVEALKRDASPLSKSKCLMDWQLVLLICVRVDITRV